MLNKYVWRGNRTQSLSDFVHLQSELRKTRLLEVVGRMPHSCDTSSFIVKLDRMLHLRVVFFRSLL